MTRINFLQGLFTIFQVFIAPIVQFLIHALTHTFHNFFQILARKGGVKIQRKSKIYIKKQTYLLHFTHLHLPGVGACIRSWCRRRCCSGFLSSGPSSSSVLLFLLSSSCPLVLFLLNCYPVLNCMTVALLRTLSDRPDNFNFFFCISCTTDTANIFHCITWHLFHCISCQTL